MVGCVLLLLAAISLSVCVAMLQNTQQYNNKNNKDEYRSRSWENMISGLRDNWQSPIMYLQKRGYIPSNQNRPFSFKFGISEEKNSEEKDCVNKEEDNEENEPDSDQQITGGDRPNPNFSLKSGIFKDVLNSATKQPSPEIEKGPLVEAENQENFLHNVKEKLLGLFRGQSPQNTQKKGKKIFNTNFQTDFEGNLQNSFIPAHAKHIDPEVEKLLEDISQNNHEYDKEILADSADRMELI